MATGCGQAGVENSRMMLNRFSLFLAVTTASLAIDAMAESPAASPAALPPESAITFESHVIPLLTKYCTKCHGGDKPKAGLALDAYRDAASVVNDRQNWELVLEMLTLRDMPPEKEPQPTAAEVRLITTWIKSELADVDRTVKRRPGRVTLRRLNRAEYNNTIRDLVGVDFKPADAFPSDDVGYGFDNIGDVLSLPPILMEKYLDAAEQIAERAIVPLPHPTRTRFEAAALDGGSGQTDPGVRALHTEGDITAEFEFPFDGEYVLRAQSFADQAGPEPARMAFQIDGERSHEIDVTGTSNARQMAKARFNVTSGRRRISIRFVNDYHKPEDPDPNNRDRNLYVEYLEVEGPFDPPEIELPQTHKRIFCCLHPESMWIHRTKHNRDCATKILRAFAKRAFRRPVTSDEVNRLLRLVDLATDRAETIEQAIRIGIQAVLVSPHFLFRVELESEPDASEADLSLPVGPYELASRLSYFLWSSMPDDQLFEVAERATLRDKDVLEDQVRRMLQDPRSHALVDNFAGQWLNLRNLTRINPDPELFPEFDEELRTAMLQETNLFFEAVMRQDLSILTFLDGPFSFLNERLARHYEIPNVAGDEFRRVSFASGERGGVLTQGSILTLTSNPTRTSPVKRGKWILENILGTPPRPPPPGVEELSEDKEARLSGSLRQRMEQHRTKPTCASCHSSMDPLGFSFEHFDAVGAWRDLDGTFPIDASGTLPSGESFNGPGELRAMLKNERRQEFTRALSHKMLTYAIGRGLEPYDKMAVDEIAQTVTRSDHRFSSLILAVVNSAPFQTRGPGEARP